MYIRHFRHRWPQIRRRPSIRAALAWSLITLAILVPFWSLSSGAVSIPSERISQILGDRLHELTGLGSPSGLDYSQREVARDQTLILDIRLPRILLGALIGLGLGAAGAALQSLFRTPYADPSLIGVTGGAAFGAVTAISAGWTLGPLFGLADGGEVAQVLAAFVFSLAATASVYRLAAAGPGQNEGPGLLLIGLALNSLAAAYVGLVSFTADEAAVGDITFWTLGDLSGAFWRDVHLLAPLMFIGLGGLLLSSRALNLLALGEAEARYLGVEVGRLRAGVMALAALMVGGGVALGGIIAFVGLMVPNAMRWLFGDQQTWLIPSSGLAGAVLVMAADWLARSIAIPSEIPIGILTSLLGGSIFLGLLLARGGR
jgi:iron complex transport system permease protein